MNERLNACFAAAYVRGVSLRTGSPALDAALLETPIDALTQKQLGALLDAGQAASLKLYRFKEQNELPRVHKALGFLKGIQPTSLLDVGSGRGVFLFPFMQAFPWVPVTSLDLLPHRVELLGDIAAGGMDSLTARQADLCTWDAPDNSFDVVTLLEVLEHIPDVESAIRNAARMAGRYVVVTVPSKPDNNPEHIHLLTKPVLTDLFTRAGCTNLRFDAVPGHLFMTAQAPR